jgi:transposase-like protein
MLLSRSRSYRDVEERSAERGITVDHVTVYRFEAVWLVCKSPLALSANLGEAPAP